VRSEGEDKLWWTPSHKGKFDVRSFYKVFACKEEDPFPGKSIWQTKVPLTVTFFAWLAMLRKILTLDNLRKKNVIVIYRYCMCKVNEEFVHHILLHCEVARTLLNAILAASVFLNYASSGGRFIRLLVDG